MTDTTHQIAARELKAAMLTIDRRHAADTAAAHQFKNPKLSDDEQQAERQRLLTAADDRRETASRVVAQAARDARERSERHVGLYPLPQPSDAELAAGRARVDRERAGGRSFAQMISDADDPATLVALAQEIPSLMRAEAGPARLGRQSPDPGPHLAAIAARRAELAGGRTAEAYFEHAEVTRLTDAAVAGLPPRSGVGYGPGSSLTAAVAAGLIRGGNTRPAADSTDAG